MRKGGGWGGAGTHGEKQERSFHNCQRRLTSPEMTYRQLLPIRGSLHGSLDRWAVQRSLHFGTERGKPVHSLTSIIHTRKSGVRKRWASVFPRFICEKTMIMWLRYGSRMSVCNVGGLTFAAWDGLIVFLNLKSQSFTFISEHYTRIIRRVCDRYHNCKA